MATSEGLATHTHVVVGELYAIQASLSATRVGETLIDVTFTSLPSKARQAVTAVATNPIHALSTIKAVRTSGTVIDVLFAEQAPSARWTGALEVIHKINAGASILARLVLAFIHFIFTVNSLVPGDTLASVSTDEVDAGGSVLAGVGHTLIQLLFTVAPRITHGTLAAVSVADRSADARVLAQEINRYPFVGGCQLTRDSGHIAVNSSPCRRTLAPRHSLFLNTSAFVFTWRPTAEVHQGLTVLPGVAQGASTAIGAQAIHTYSSMQTWLRITLIDLVQTEGASEAHGTQAREGINPIHACPTIETGALCAFVDVILTVDTIKPRLALASVAVDVVGAGSSILTRFTQTFIHVCLTLISSETRKTVAGESIHSIHTRTSILARVGKAVIDVFLTVHTTEAGRTFTHVAALGVVAETMVLAGLGDTLINIHCTLLTLPARSTRTAVTLKIGVLFTNTSILTWVWRTRSQYNLTVLACVWQHTMACVATYVINAGSLV